MRLLIALVLCATPAAAAEPLPQEALVRLGSSQFQLGTTVVSAGFTADGKRVFAGTQSGLVVVVDPASGEEKGRMQLPNFNGRAMLFSADGSLLVAVGYDNTVRIVETDSGKAVCPPINLPHGMNSLAWLVPNKSFVAASNGRLHIFGLDGKQVRSWPAPVSADSAVVCSADGKLTAATDNAGTVHLWEAETGKSVRSLEQFQPATPGSQRGNIAFVGDGKSLVQAVQGPKVPVWDVETGKLTRTLGDEKDPVYAMSLAPTADGKFLIVAATNQRTQVWGLASGKKLREFDGFELGTSVAVAPDGKTAITCGQGAALRLWDVEKGKLLHAAAGHRSPIRQMVYLNGGKRLATLGGDNVVCLWDTAAGKELDRLKPSFPILGMGRTTGDDGVVLADYSYTVHIWRSGKELEQMKFAVPVGGSHGRFSPDGRWFASINNNALRLFDLKTAQAKTLEATVSTQAFSRLLYSADSRTLTLIGVSERQVWDLAGGKRIEGPDLPEKPRQRTPRSWAMSPEGRTLVSFAYNGAVQVVEFFSGHERASFAPPPKALNGMAMTLSPDGRYLAIAIDRGEIWVHDLATAATSGPFKAHSNWVYELEYSPDGQRLTSASADTTAVVWDATKLRPARALLPREPAAADLVSSWVDLGKNGVAANYAIWAFASAPPALTIEFLTKRWKDQEDLPLRPIDQLIRELDHDKFSVREQATRELRAWGEEARSSMLKALAASPSAEKKRRIDLVLKDLGREIPALTLRFHRTLEVLQRLNTPQARKLIEELAKHPDPTLAAEAKRALKK